MIMDMFLCFVIRDFWGFKVLYICIITLNRTQDSRDIRIEHKHSEREERLRVK